MKELVILSGKGGTGKTSITAAFTALALEQNLDPVICDTDVDAADLHLILTPDICEENNFQGGYEASIVHDRCTQCGTCIDLCRFDAISQAFNIDSFSCEGCGVCADLCPEGAIDFNATNCGQWFISDSRFGPFVHARLGIGEENSGKLVAKVREEARNLAERTGRHFIITDGPPGIGCPVIASISQATAVLIIAEPTVSGLHDMKRVGELCRHFNIPAMVCINKFDLNPGQSNAIEDYAEQNHIHTVGRIEFSPVFIQAMIHEKSIFEYTRNTNTGKQIKKIWHNVLSYMQTESEPVPQWSFQKTTP